MSTPPPSERDLQAFVDLIRSRLMRGEAVRIQGLGTFRPHHEPSRVEIGLNFQRIVLPPRDTVVFTPDEP